MMRCCKTCNLEQPLENFHKGKGNKDGRIPHCKECESKKNKMNYVPSKDPRHKINPDDLHNLTTKWCWYGQHFESKSLFNSSFNRKDGLSSMYKKCNVLYKKDQRLNNSKHIKKKDKEYYQRTRNSQDKIDKANKLKREKYDPAKNREYFHKRRALKKSIPDTMPKGWWQMMLDFYGAKCAKCGSEENLSHDHIIPVTHPDSSHSLFNSQILCMSCNSSKKNYDVIDYRDWSKGILM